MEGGCSRTEADTTVLNALTFGQLIFADMGADFTAGKAAFELGSNGN